ncbi:nitronate monooxygenase family protein [Paenibacillus chondroitinus]|uniref:Probable nitronate monooxygenase n=1 Tax=Paenibacillus chondroitinus TaxID=59842 RepID=A0ABU6DAT9_9BACL|nr:MULTISPECIES: nitronate monooxygenase family protein [Paenibacillus]MCY9659748.1 nitronate monooxygenase family protein [Paenibacillus anseongense]MEB4794073.1 nitronate monooxygenase family protein [Paenibacillus chondroitinus]
MTLQLTTDICRIFKIKYPLFLAGMAGVPGTVNLAAAVSNAGGLGTIGAAYMTPDAIQVAIRELKQLTDAPFGVNLFAIRVPDNNTRTQVVQQELNKVRGQLGIAEATGENVSTPDYFDEQIAVLLEEKVPVISTAFGVLSEAHRQKAKEEGLRIVTMVTTVKEAILAEQAGCDAIVAQGSEAGGHRGTFDISNHPMGANIGTIALVPQIVDQVRIPVIAAGGIMDGRGLVAALALGAQGVQMGTRFLTAFESGANVAYKEALLKSTEESTVITKAYSGRPARGIVNSFIRQWDERGIEPLPFPTQNTITRDIRNASADQRNAEYMSLWAGQGTRMLTDGEKAGDLIAKIMQQASAILK